VAAVGAAYANALPASFQFDDWSVAVHDPRVQTLAAWWASMPGIRPLLKLSYALNNALGGSALGFHAFNVVVHALNAILVFAIFRKLAERYGAEVENARSLALAVALLFALSPVQTEAVTYVTGRSTSLAACFSLASLLVWTRGRPLLSAALFAAAVLVKETAVVLALAIVLWELTVPGRWTAREIALELRWHVAVLALAAIGLAASPDYRFLARKSFATRSVGSNLATQADAAAYLAGQLVRFDRLNADPAHPVVHAVTGPGIAAVSVLVSGLVLLRWSPPLAFGILWFFVWLLPTNSFIPRLDTVNDRQVYLAALGPVWALVWGASRVLGPRLLSVTALAACAVLGTAVHARNDVYRSEIGFWEDVARKSPHNPRAFNNVGYAYALAHRTEEAEAAFELALALDPAYVRAAANLKLLRAGALTSENASR
jgi:hypothetical protein